MICRKCGKYVTDKSLFCNYCGNKIQTECPHCGRLLSADSLFCNYCGTRLSNIPETSSYDDISNDYDECYIKTFLEQPNCEIPEEVISFLNNMDLERNPILNSPDDITNELIEKILENDLDSLTINYEFTRCQNEDEELYEWENEQNQNNPFWRANSVKPLKRLEFEIKLGSNVHSLAYAFWQFEELEYVNIKDTSNVTDMSGMFAETKSFNQPIGNWDTSKVTNMNSMFHGAESFNQPIGNWNTSKVTDMADMFEYATSFNQPIGNWDTSKVTDMYSMFKGAKSFNQPIGNWDTSKVTDMSRMFEDATSFNQPIGNRDTSKVTYMDDYLIDDYLPDEEDDYLPDEEDDYDEEYYGKRKSNFVCNEWNEQTWEEYKDWLKEGTGLESEYWGDMEPDAHD